MTEHTRRTILTGASVLDGTGQPPRRGVVVIEDGWTVAVCDRFDTDATDEVVDLSGWSLAPGFIDMHAHSDLQMLLEPTCDAKVTQGVTTEVNGQDGLSFAPTTEETLPQLGSRIRGWNGDPAGLSVGWGSTSEYLAALPGTGCNAAYLVPHGNVRELVMGTREGGADSRELATQQEILRQNLEEGAFGLSAGLTYVPGMFAPTEELIALCRVVATADRLFVPHHRNYGADVLGGYEECFEIARRSGVRLHLAHAHLSWSANRHLIGPLLDLFDKAEKEGVDFSFDSYPYAASMSTLHAQFPSWSQAGTPEEQVRMFSDPASRRRIAQATEHLGSDGHSGMVLDWSTVVLAGVPDGEWAWTAGRAVSEVAESMGTTPVEAAMDLLLETEFAATCILFIGHEPHVRTLMQHPRHTVGSDGILAGTRVHPRAWGTFARVLGEYVRRAKVLTLPEAVRHMTSAPAERLRLADRGRVAPGYRADLVVFDPEAIDSPADYEHPRRPAVGIRDVWCNGVRTLRAGRTTGATPGFALVAGDAPPD